MIFVLVESIGKRPLRADLWLCRAGLVPHRSEVAFAAHFSEDY